MSDDPTAPVFATVVSEPDDEVVAPRQKVYGVPRRFGMGTIFVVMTAFALLFAVLRNYGVRGEIVLILGGYLGTVGFAQMLLFGGKRPRAASIVTGMALAALLSLAWTAPMIGQWSAFARLDVVSALLLLFGYAVGTIFFVGTFGVLFGYTGGGVVAGVFLIMDYVECWLYGQREAAGGWRTERSDP